MKTMMLTLLMVIFICYYSNTFSASSGTTWAFVLVSNNHNSKRVLDEKKLTNGSGYHRRDNRQHQMHAQLDNDTRRRKRQRRTRLELGSRGQIQIRSSNAFTSTTNKMIVLGVGEYDGIILGVNSDNTVLSETLLWTIRTISALVSYIGFISFYDRPRGTLYVKDGVDVEVKQSTVPGAGLGLFAKNTLPKDTVLGTYPGVVIPLRQNLVKLQNYPSCEGFIWRFSDNKAVIDPTNTQGMLDFVCYGGNPSLPGSVLVMTTLLRFISVSTLLCRINEPPRGMDVNVITIEDCTTRQVTFQLERTVYSGEELFIDYGLSYDRSMYGGNGSTSSSD